MFLKRAISRQRNVAIKVSLTRFVLTIYDLCNIGEVMLHFVLNIVANASNLLCYFLSEWHNCASFYCLIECLDLD